MTDKSEEDENIYNNLMYKIKKEI